jgi:acyl-CoA synthetase (NDP forming)
LEKSISEDSSGMILEPDAVQLLDAFHIPYPDHALARDADEAVRAADSLGYPVVLKVVSPEVVHKSDAGGVQVNLGGSADVKEAFHQVTERVRHNVPHARVEGILVCRQAPAGVELIVGALKDATFGAVIMFGLGGVYTELLKDISFRMLPIQRRDAQEMVKEIRGYPLLNGMRGGPKCDTQALEDLLLNVSQLISAHPEIDELDLNPVRVYEHGLLSLDVRMISKLGKE